MQPFNHCLIKINLPGGIVPVGDLMELLAFANKAGIQQVRFGNRQQLYLTASTAQLESLERDFFKAEIAYEVGTDVHPNPVSSYVAADILNGNTWLREGVYKDVLTSFNYQPKLKINLTDGTQCLVPFFTGNLNFIASETGNYWHLYVRFPKTNIQYQWPSLIYSEDVAGISAAIETQILTHAHLFYDQPVIDGNALFELVSAHGNFGFQSPGQLFKLPNYQQACYEGFNAYGNQKCWLGIYRRDEWFTVSLLEELCQACQTQGLGQLYTTPWKSLIIKGIQLSDQPVWERILDKHRINTRHHANELNWQLEDNIDYSLQLKQQMVRILNDLDIRTHNLCFAVKTQPKTGLFGGVILRRQATGSFDILHTPDFNPNAKHYLVYKQQVDEVDLASALQQLINYYYDDYLNADTEPLAYYEPETEVQDHQVNRIYECTTCFTQYNPLYGDLEQGIRPGTEFLDLEVYQCPVCDAAKEVWEEVISHR